eukprot:GHVO01027758.1.p1 GENE.GHVO01027758.1~~GHVO01027758.1.p1  ORF type:complete len:129 (+),score=4.37 GHVO01027758.1:3-389(+)
MGLSPLAALSTSTFMILFTSSTTTTLFILAGRLHPLESICVFMLAAVASLIGHYMIERAVARSGRQSVATLVLATTILVSMISMSLSMLYNELYIPTNASLTIEDACRTLDRQPIPKIINGILSRINS